MDDATWSNVDDYVSASVVHEPATLQAARQDMDDLPAIQVSTPQGKMLHLLVRAVGARRVLEIGTLAGYSAIWMASALPDGGRLVTLEVSEHHAAVARANIERAGLGGQVEIRVGPALESLEQLAAEGGDPFDLVFIDADKPPTAEYFDHAVRLSRRGAVIVVDNVVREGALIDSSSDDPAVQGMRRFVAAMAQDQRVSGTVVQTVGSKKYDGFALAVVL